MGEGEGGNGNDGDAGCELEMTDGGVEDGWKGKEEGDGDEGSESQRVMVEVRREWVMDGMGWMG